MTSRTGLAHLPECGSLLEIKYGVKQEQGIRGEPYPLCELLLLPMSKAQYAQYTQDSPTPGRDAGKKAGTQLRETHLPISSTIKTTFKFFSPGFMSFIKKYVSFAILMLLLRIRTQVLQGLGHTEQDRASLGGEARQGEKCRQSVSSPRWGLYVLFLGGGRGADTEVTRPDIPLLSPHRRLLHSLPLAEHFQSEGLHPGTGTCSPERGHVQLR